MSLSKKHYEAVADILRTERESTDREYQDPHRRATSRYTLDRVELAMVTYFQADNPSFDPGRFRRAAQP